MNPRLGFIMALAAAAVAAPAVATDPQPAMIDDGYKVICKKEAKTGTRQLTKTCHTKAEWEQIRIQNQRDLKEIIDRPQVETRNGG